MGTRRRLFAIAIWMLAASLVLAGPASAGHDEPERARKLKLDLVNSYHGPIGCSPNTQTQSQFGGNWPACTPATPSDPAGCGFTPTGRGKFLVVVTGNVDRGSQDLKVGAVADGLNASCEGVELCITLNFRATTDDCAAGSCTTPDAFDFVLPPPFCCTVVDGECRIAKTSFARDFPDFFLSNLNTGFELLGCGLQRRSPSAAGNAVSCGILLK